MILEATKQLEIETIGEMEQGLTAGIDQESLPFVFELVSKQLYSNPIGSVVREVTSNCLDSHVEAGNTDDPVIVRYRNDPDEGQMIEFQDFGVGISPSRIQQIYMNYFSSTKRGNNKEIGGFGIGSKTPLAYTDMFYITTVFNLMKYELIFHKGTTKPELESLNGWDYHSEIRYRRSVDADGRTLGTDEPYTFKWKTPQGVPTEERNGTIIKVPIANDTDKRKFISEIRFQLAYFDNVYFDGWGVTNNYKIYEGKHFKFRSDIDSSNTDIHLCVGKVRYPIDTSKVRINNNYTRIPIAVKFDIGELNITPSREALRYDDKGIKLIEERVNLAGSEILEKFDSQNPEIEDLRQWQKGLGDTPCIWFDREAGHKLNLWAHSGMSKNFRFKPLAGLGIKKTPTNLFFMWEAFAKIDSNGKRHDTTSWGSEKLVDNDFILNKKYLIVKDSDRPSIYTDLKIAREQGHIYNNMYLIRRKKVDPMDTFKLLGIKTEEKDATTKVLGKAKTVMGYIKKITELVEGSGMKYYSDHKADDAWIAAYKRSIIESSAAWQRKRAQRIFYKNVPSFSGSEDTAAKFLSRTGILVFGYKEDRQRLIEIEAVVTSSKESYRNIKTSFRKNGTPKLSKYERQDKAFKVIMIAKPVINDIVGPHKTIHWEDFIKTGYFKEIYTARIMYEKFYSLHYENRTLREKFLPTFKEDYEEVDNMIKKHFKSGFSPSLYRLCQDLDIKPIKSMMKLLDDFVAKYDFEIPLIGSVGSIHSKRDLASLVWFLKFEKIRLKNEFYLKPQEVIAQEQGVYSIIKTINNYSSTTKQLNYVRQDSNNNDTPTVPSEETGEDLHSHIGEGEVLQECDSRGMGDLEGADSSLQQEALRNNEEEDSQNPDTGESSSEGEAGEERSSGEGYQTANQEGGEESQSGEERDSTGV